MTVRATLLPMIEGPPVRTICVFCGSRFGADPAFVAAAARMGAAIARRGLTLVYGGAKVGLMGALADAALAEGGRVVGIMPRALVQREVAHDGIAELFVTENMHDRKDRMICLSDAFVSLPGGFGTFDEAFEVLTLGQIGIHQKPSAFLNVNDYFTPLAKLMEHTIASGFAERAHGHLFHFDDDVEHLLDTLVAWRPR